MKGTIRTKEKCPVCHKPFSHIPKLGFLCSDHKTTPTKVYLDLFWNGQRIRIFSDKQGQGLDSYQRALNLQAKITHEIENYIFDPSKYVRSEVEKFWAMNLLDQFKTYKLDSIAPSYQGNYRGMIQAARDYFGVDDVRDLRKLDLINYKAHLEGKGITGKTLKNYLDLLKSFLNYCRNDLEVIVSFPSFPDVEVQEPKFKWVDQEDQIRLFEHISESDKPIFAFLMLHGCRPSEARALKIKDVDLRNQTITISATFSGRVYREKRKGKRSKSVVIPVHSEMIEFIASRVCQGLPEAFLFINPRTGKPYSQNRLRKIWDKVRKKAGISKQLRLYDATRHSFASQLIKSGASLLAVSKLLGHSSTKMTERYTHQAIEGLRTDLQKLSLKNVVTVTRPSPETISKEKTNLISMG